MPATLKAPVRRAAANATLELPFRIPDKDWFTIKETATLSGMGWRYVDKKFDQGTELSGHEHNAESGQRNTKKIPRVWLVAWMISTARYDDASLGDALIGCLRHLSREVLLRIASSATRLAEEKTRRSA